MKNHQKALIEAMNNKPQRLFKILKTLNSIPKDRIISFMNKRYKIAKETTEAALKELQLH